MMETIALENIGKTFTSSPKEVQALNNVNMTIKKGTITVVLGPSGSGKSTLLSILGGIELPSHGEIYYDNLKLSGTSPSSRVQLRKNNFGFIFQNFALINHLTSAENLDHYLLIHNTRNPKIRKQLTSTLLDKVGLLHRKDYFPYELSGGEKQRLALARALSTQPSFIFADEPTGRLDTDNAISTLNFFLKCVQESASGLVIFTHDSRIDFLNTKIKLFLLEYGILTSLN